MLAIRNPNLKQCISLDAIDSYILHNNFKAINRADFAIQNKQYDLAKLLIAQDYELHAKTCLDILVTDVTKISPDQIKFEQQTFFELIEFTRNIVFEQVFRDYKEHSHFIKLAEFILLYKPKIFPSTLKKLIEASKIKPEFIKLINHKYIQHKLYLNGNAGAYHNTLNSLVSQTNIQAINKELVKNRYAKLLSQHPILSDILYTVSIKKDSQTAFETWQNKCGLAHFKGCYNALIDTIYIYDYDKNNFSHGMYMHEQCHKFILHIFGNTNPYTNQIEQKRYKAAIRKTLYNIATIFGKDDHDDLEQMNTWEVGQEIIPLVYKTNVTHVEFHNKKVSFITQKVVALNFFTIYEHYKEADEHAEFIVRLPEIIAENDYNKDIQEIVRPLLEYWNDIITPKMIEHLSIFDHSEFCTIPNFI